MSVAQVFPTLSQSESYVRFTADITGAVQFTLMNSMGLVVSQKTLTNPAAREVTELSVAELPQGAYFVRIEYGRGVQTEPIIVSR